MLLIRSDELSASAAAATGADLDTRLNALAAIPETLNHLEVRSRNSTVFICSNESTELRLARASTSLVKTP